MPDKLFKALAKGSAAVRTNRPGSAKDAYGVPPRKKGRVIKSSVQGK